MNMPTRRYRMGARAEAAARNAEAILAATVELWRERELDDITLEAIAERAGVSVRTAIRRFGSRDGVIEATVEAHGAKVTAERDQAAVGDVDGALEILLLHYERDGDALLRTLALEEKVVAARAVTDAGRQSHRGWCARVFAPYLPHPDNGEYAAHLDAFVAATDLYLWKLVRLDLGRSTAETKGVIRALLDGLIARSPNRR